MEGLPKEKIEVFDSIVISLSTALKNCVLYPHNHPLVESAISALKEALDRWFVDEMAMELGISQDNLLLNSEFVKEDSKLYAEVADYLHQRGIIAISIIKGITMSELIEFFKVIRNDAKAFAQIGGIKKNMPSSSNLMIKEIDYSAFLASETQGLTVEDKDVWQSLSRIAMDSMAGQLPESKIEFLMDFLKDTKKSTATLNKIYKDSLVKLGEKPAVENIRNTFARITKYLQGHPAGDAQEAGRNLADIISGLDPNLVAGIFEEANIDGGTFDLSKELLKHFSDDMMAEFITSMINKEGRINENLLKLFDKLVSEEDRSSVVMMVTDKLLEKNLLDKNILSQLQLSIKEAFQAHPDSNFMSQIYKMTVDTFVSKGVASEAGPGRYSPLVREYIEFLTEENLKKEKIRLLLNIIWFEKDPGQFKKFSDILFGIFPEILDVKYTTSIREVFELFTEKIRPEQKNNDLISAELKNIINKISDRQTISKIVSLIPKVYGDDLEDICYVLTHMEMSSSGLLIDAFISENDAANRSKLGYVLSKMSWEISRDISRRLESTASENILAVKDLFKVLKGLDPEEARLVTKRMIQHESPQMRLEALEGFMPETEEERDIIFDIFKKERDPKIQSRIIAVLVKTENKEIINKLFRETEKGSLRRRYLLELVQLCGDLKILDSVPHLAKILAKRPFFSSKEINTLRVAVVVSLGQVDSPEAKELIQKTLNDKSEAVSRMCRIVLELDKEKAQEPQNKGNKYKNDIG